MTENLKKGSATDYFKDVVKGFKEFLPSDWKERVYLKFPELRTPEGYTLLSNTYQLKSAARVDVILYMADLAQANKSKI